MRISRLCLILVALPMVVACFSDRSTEATRQLSHITIESGIDSVYNIDKNDTLFIEPVITQSNKEKPLSYTWEIDLKPISHDRTFTYVGNALGKYNCRLVVENEDGKSFFPFLLYVNSPYEEGITLLSRDTQGNSMLSFMQESYSGEKPSFTAGDCFAVNNPDVQFAAGAADIVQCSGSLIIACQGGGERDDLPTIYYLNEKTLVVENMFTVPEYDDFRPTILGVTSSGHSGSAYPIVCENGSVYELSTTEAVIAKPRMLQSTYAQSCIVNNGSYPDILLWDKENNALAQIHNNYGPYFCSTEYMLELADPLFNSKNYFNGREFIAMAKINMTIKQSAENDQEFLILSRIANTPMAICEKMYTYLWLDEETGLRLLNSSRGVVEESPLKAETPCVANMTYKSLLFADGNKVRRWYYETNVSQLPVAPVLLTVGSDSAVITAFEISADHLKTYVAFYEPNVEGLNGSVWVFDTDTGDVLEKYENICYKPVKMFYKAR